MHVRTYSYAVLTSHLFPGRAFADDVVILESEASHSQSARYVQWVTVLRTHANYATYATRIDEICLLNGKIITIVQRGSVLAEFTSEEGAFARIGDDDGSSRWLDYVPRVKQLSWSARLRLAKSLVDCFAWLHTAFAHPLILCDWHIA
jgi:hypothetical protein